MTTETLLRCGINRKFYIDKYSSRVPTLLLDGIIALDMIHKIEIPVNTALELTNAILDNHSRMSEHYDIFDFLTKILNHHYGGDPEFPYLQSRNRAIDITFAFNESVFCGEVQEEDFTVLRNFMSNVSSVYKDTILRAVICYPSEFMSILNLNLEEEEVFTYLEEMFSRLTVEKCKEIAMTKISYMMFL